MTNYITEEVIDFISRRFKSDNNWKTGNCFYFSVILKERFSKYSPEIYYDVCDGHFLCKIMDRFYDWTGEVTYDRLYLSKYMKNWSTFATYDELQFNRVIRDVIM